MDWNSNSKWDWEHSDSPKKMGQLADWNPGPYNSGGSYTYTAGHNSSAKSSMSASTDSSTRDFRFSAFEANLSKQMEYSGNSPSMEASSVGSGEPLIGLKLGKRTYFENNTTFTVMPTPSCTTLKKNKSSSQNASVCCQVEGCNVDLSGAKDYHRKHRVCDIHSKFPKVIVGGLERRFCQQCSRFHSLCEFDERKRSCRRRLSNHNARRRKPQPETIQFNSTRSLSSPFYGIGLVYKTCLSSLFVISFFA